MEKLIRQLKKFDILTKNLDLLMAVALMSILAVMLIPLPAFMLDMALSISLSISLLVLLVSIYTDKSLDFSSFPSLLLLTTLFRLSLNVASTRKILSDGHEGGQAAGQVISAFGEVMVGNNYVIGLIVFTILVVINFIVITKGSGRVAEVAARFTLDAMPGKQMSIDADLNAGLMSEEEARKKRKEIEKEADFYGAMDGASKFVRGDAIAGIIITFINIVGGLLVGLLQKDLDLATAAKNYTMLTVGDGLVSQIPALIISTAAGIVVTRESSNESMGSIVARQLFVKPKAIAAVAGIIGILGMVPGLPKTPFFLIAVTLGVIAYVMHQLNLQEIEDQKKSELNQDVLTEKETIENLLPLDLIEVEVGYGLISVVESQNSGDLLERIVSIRKQFALDLGIIIPSVHLRDNLELAPGEYRVLIKGNKVAGGELRPDSFMAMDPGDTSEVIDGVATKEPAFGLDAMWISKAQKEQAEIAGYTVVDLPTVMATHLTEIIKIHTHELFGRQEADSLISNFKKQYPKVVEDLIPDTLPLGTVVKVLQNLLKEQVSIRDLLTIFETLADEGVKTKDAEVLTEEVRKALARNITIKYSEGRNEISIISLGANYEEIISNSLLQTEKGVQLVLEPQIAQKLIVDVSEAIEKHPDIAAQPILMTSPTLRRHVYGLLSRFIPQIIVLAHSEISSNVTIDNQETLEMNHAG